MRNLEGYHVELLRQLEASERGGLFVGVHASDTKVASAHVGKLARAGLIFLQRVAGRRWAQLTTAGRAYLAELDAATPSTD